MSKRISGNTTTDRQDKDFIFVTAENLSDQEELNAINAMSELPVNKLSENGTFSRLGIPVDSVSSEIQALSSTLLVDEQIDVSTLLSLMLISLKRTMKVILNPWRNVSSL